MTNMRAYRDGKRLVVVIEDPTRDLEDLVGAMLTGEISSVKNLDQPKRMARPELDLKNMEEIKPQPATNETETKPEVKKARFVEKLEAEKKELSVKAEDPHSAIPVAEKTADEKIETLKENDSDAPKQSEPVKEAPKAEEIVTKPAESIKTEPVRKQPEPPAENNASAKPVTTETNTQTDTAKPNASQPVRETEPSYESVIRFLQTKKSTPKLLAYLRKYFHTTDVNEVIKKENEQTVRKLARLIR